MPVRCGQRTDIKACLQTKSVVSLRWIDDETAMTDNSMLVHVAPPTPGTATPAAKRHQPNNNHLNDMSITPTAKPARLEFTLQMPVKRDETTNKRGDRPYYKTPAKSTNGRKRATKKDDHTPAQIKEIKKKQQSQSTSEHHNLPKKSKEKIPKKASKSHKHDKKEATQKNSKKKWKQKRDKMKKTRNKHKYGNNTTT